MGKAMGKEEITEEITRETARETAEDHWTLESVLSHIEVIYNLYETGRERADRILQFARQVKETIK